MALLILAISPGLGTTQAWAGVQYLYDGTSQRADGGWDVPTQGSCPADPTRTTRPDCLSLRLAIPQASCTSPNYSWTTSGVCNDLVNTTVGACEAEEDRSWNAGTNTCAIVMKGDDRNNVTCALHGGTWVTAGTCTGAWVFPAGSTYTPPLLTGTGPGDQCLRCHNAFTQYNGPRVRDVENFIYTGHKNMSRKVAPVPIGETGKPWGGPPFSCTNPAYADEQTCEDNGEEWEPTIYPTDDAGNPFTWDDGTITTSGGIYDLAWIFADWLSPFPRAIAKLPASTSSTCSLPLPGACSDPAYLSKVDCEAATQTWTSNTSQGGCELNGGTWVKNAGASYSCARCHTTGWTSDASVNTLKEPWKSFPGITWARTGDAVDGQVNTAGAVTGDPGKSSSWDTWGISCSRCHASAVDNDRANCTGLTQATCVSLSGTWSASTSTCSGITPAQCSGGGGTVTTYAAAAGYSSHHNNLTATDSGSGSGYCSDARFMTQAACDAAQGAWLTACSIAGACSLGGYDTSGACVAAGGAWTSWNTQTLCQSNSATWYTGSCSVAGVCNTLNPAHNTSGTCSAAGGQWASATDVVRCLDIHEFGKENGIPAYEAAKWTGSKANRGQIITRVCMDCHRQETGGLPYANASSSPGTLASVNPGRFIKVGPAHGSVDFVSHPHGNQFLNSPHGKFTGTFNEIATGKFNFAMTGLYKSFFQIDGEAANTGNGCTGCHDVHESVVAETSPLSAIREKCVDCHAKNLNLVNHPRLTGTPLEEMDTEPARACISCHMPNGEHLFRINTDAGYTAFPPAALSATVNAPTAPDGSFADAVWVDLDRACGQCHGGGLAAKTTTGSVVKDSKVLTVADSTDFVVGERLSVADAGSLTYDGVGDQVAGDFESFVVAVPDATTITMAGAPPRTVSGKTVVQNPTRNNAPYLTRAQLAVLAEGMHNDKPSVIFSYTIGTPIPLAPVSPVSLTLSGGGSPSRGAALTARHVSLEVGDAILESRRTDPAESPRAGLAARSRTRQISSRTLPLAPSNTLQLNVNASDSLCSGSAASCDAYDWNWGDDTPNGSGKIASHVYALPGTYVVELTVEEFGVGGGSTSRTISVYTPDLPPLVAGDCSLDANTWTATVTDTSTDDNGVAQVTVSWGDGSVLSVDSAAPFGPFSHTYLNAGTFTISHKSIDTIGQQAVLTCEVSPAYFLISGTVRKPGGTTPLPGAVVTVRNGATTVGAATTAVDGSFSVGNLKPGTYTLAVTRYGYSFADPAATLTVGPSRTGNLIDALTGP